MPEVLGDHSMAVWSWEMIVGILEAILDVYIKGWFMLAVRGISYIAVLLGLILYFKDREWKEFLKYLLYNLITVTAVILCYRKILPFWCLFVADWILLSHFVTSLKILVEGVVEGLGYLAGLIWKIRKS